MLNKHFTECPSEIWNLNDADTQIRLYASVYPYIQHPYREGLILNLHSSAVASVGQEEARKPERTLSTQHTAP